MDKFDQARETLTGTPGFVHRISTIKPPGLSWLSKASYIIETIRTDDAKAIFIEVISAEGAQRIVIPNKVCEAIYSHYQAIMGVRRKMRAQRGAATRKAKATTHSKLQEPDSDEPNGNK